MTPARVRVSAVIPAYNLAELTVLAVRSALGQTRPPDEVVVVDDGSKDDTVAVLTREFGDRIRLIPQENRGCALARDAAIRASTGEFIAMLDCDDEWLPRHVEQCLAEFDRRPDLVMVHTAAVRVLDDGSPSDRSPREPHDGNVFVPLLAGNFVTCPTVVLRRAAYEKAGSFRKEAEYCDDWDEWLRVARLGPIGYLPQATIRYRDREASMSRNRLRALGGRAWVLSYWEERLRAEDDRAALAACREALAQQTMFLGDEHSYRGEGREALRWWWKAMLRSPSAENAARFTRGLRRLAGRKTKAPAAPVTR